MRDAKSDIERRGAKLWIVGHGTPHWARAFAEETGLEGSVLTDPERVLYRALGFRKGLSTTVTLGAARNTMRALLAGHRQVGVRGDPWQQGGAAVISKDGELTYVYVSQTSGDHAPVADVLRAIG